MHYYAISYLYAELYVIADFRKFIYDSHRTTSF